ncbi:NAD(P)H-binding protein [Pedobacter sp. P351]|uniref:NAD(P)H-binding protein n=1 Tax=Pedobacter superstes TaxID=3133441 RepID=UPI0030B0D629
MKRVIIAGASGLIGSNLLKLLLNKKEFGEVVVLVRKPLPLSNVKLVQIITNFDSLEKVRNEIFGDALYCCLGSTKSKTPDVLDYRKVDHDYPVTLARIASENKVAQFHLISSLGADTNSKIFYSKLKGETEKDIIEFSFKSIHIYQPSLLTGDRKENRWLERLAITIMSILNPFLMGSLKKYKSIKAITVAQAMINQTLKNVEGVHIYPSPIIKQLS